MYMMMPKIVNILLGLSVVIALGDTAKIMPRHNVLFPAKGKRNHIDSLKDDVRSRQPALALLLTYNTDFGKGINPCETKVRTIQIEDHGETGEAIKTSNIRPIIQLPRNWGYDNKLSKSDESLSSSASSSSSDSESLPSESWSAQSISFSDSSSSSESYSEDESKCENNKSLNMKSKPPKDLIRRIVIKPKESSYSSSSSSESESSSSSDDSFEVQGCRGTKKSDLKHEKKKGGGQFNSKKSNRNIKYKIVKKH